MSNLCSNSSPLPQPGRCWREKVVISVEEADLGHLNPVVLKGISATVVNVLMPCLVFSKTVPSFTSENLSEIGVLILTAVFYQSEICQGVPDG